MYTQLSSRILFPLHERLKGHHSVAMRKLLEKSQWLSTAELEQQRLDRLRQFLVQAGRNVPFYRELFATRQFDPQRLTSLADLAQLPFLTKPLIRENTQRLQSMVAGKLVRYNTGGSSGEPLVFYMGMGRVSHDVAAKWRATRWWGVDIGDPEIVLWGSPVELGKQDRIKAVRDRVFRSHLLPAFQMSPQKMDEYLTAIRRIRPRMMFGYASALNLLARHAEQRGVMLSGLGIKVVFATGETLYSQQRQQIERVFAAPVANGYGSRDAGFIAHQCPQGSLHQSAEHIIVEVVDAQGRPVPVGQQGEIVITHMATDDFPFIRYRTGDMAVATGELCACGRGLPVLQEVLGRTTDFIYTSSGNAMHALALIYEVRDKPGVRAFKIIQAADLSVEVLLVADAELTTETVQTIVAGLTKRLGPGASVTVRRVTEIPPEKSGKYRYVISHATPR